MDKNQLKVQALLERISTLTTEYENRCADYRVEITSLSNELQVVTNELAELQKNLDHSEDTSAEDVADEPLEPVVVPDETEF